MAKRNALAAMGVAVALTGLTAQSAMAGTVARDKDLQTGQVRLLFGESRQPDPIDPTKTVPISEINTITVTALSGGGYRVHDSTSPLTPRSSGSGCDVVDPNTVDCAVTDITVLSFPLGLNNDSFDNQTDTPSFVQGGPGSDRIIDAGGGDDTVDIAGREIDDLTSCGGGVDHLLSDRQDNVPKDNACEFINGVDQSGPTPPPPPPDTGGGSSGGAPPPPPVTKPAITAAPAGTAAPVAASDLPVAPTVKPGACQIKYIGTAADDRVDGSLDGDIEYGLAGADYMTGQDGDDCLYGGLGADTLIGAGGLDLVVGEAGNDKAYGGDGNDRVFGNAGNDRVYGNAGADRVSGGAGNDRASGDAGNDAVLGADGNDSLAGGSGNDTVSGGAGKDAISGGPGSDTMSGGLGRDTVRGDAGNDKINVRDGQRDVVNCGSGRDSVTADKVDVLRNCENVTRR
jgi:Ca2+-binding RTX toxin-like protein